MTIDSIFEATTTVQIAERAGVSVGSLYQYFPNKNALLAAVVQRHVGEVVDATIEACRSAHGNRIREMCTTMMSAFVDAKTRRPEVRASAAGQQVAGQLHRRAHSGGDRADFENLKLHLVALTVGYLKEVSTARRLHRPRRAR